MQNNSLGLSLKYCFSYLQVLFCIKIARRLEPAIPENLQEIANEFARSKSFYPQT